MRRVFRARVGFLTVVAICATVHETVLPASNAEHPDIEVSISFIANHTEYEEKLIVAHAGGSPPDVFTIPGRGPSEFKAAGFLAPLDDYVKRWGEEKDYLPVAWATVSFDGIPYGIPWSVQGPLLGVDGCLMAEVGLPAQAPATWEDYGLAARRLTLADSQGLQRIGAKPVSHHAFYLWLHSAGGDLFTPDNSKALLNQEPGVTALSFLVELQQTIAQGMSYSGLTFYNRRAGMQFVEPSDLPAVYQIDPAHGREILIGPVPKKERHVSRVYVPALAISAASQKKDAAFAWLAFLQRPENVLAYNSQFGRLPPRMSLFRPSNLTALPQLMNYAQIYSTYGIPHRFPAARGQLMFNELTKALDKAFRGQVSPREALDQATKAWNLIIAEGL